MKTIRKSFFVPNITCGHCVATIQRELGEEPGVVSVRADERTKRVTLEWDEERVGWSDLQSLMEEIHFPPGQEIG